jgi:hypothetical protein
MLLPLVIAIFIVIAVASMVWKFSHARALLVDWTQANDYTIEDAQARWFSFGPFRWKTGKGDVVYQLRVRNDSGVVRTGWARCGGGIQGMWDNNKVKVVWDDEADSEPVDPVPSQDD